MNTLPSWLLVLLLACGLHTARSGPVELIDANIDEYMTADKSLLILVREQAHKLESNLYLERILTSTTNSLCLVFPLKKVLRVSAVDETSTWL